MARAGSALIGFRNSFRILKSFSTCIHSRVVTRKFADSGSALVSGRRTPPRRFLGIAVAAVIGGVTVSCLWTARDRRQFKALFSGLPEPSASLADWEELQVKLRPDIEQYHTQVIDPLALQVGHTVGKDSQAKLVLFAFNNCPFCHKVRSYLEFMGLAYEIVEVNPLTWREIKWANWRKLPMLIVDGVGPQGFVQLYDSSMIVSILETMFVCGTEPSNVQLYYPVLVDHDGTKITYDFPNKYNLIRGKDDLSVDMIKSLTDEKRWREWVDTVYMHLITPNIYRNTRESYDTLRCFAREGRWSELFPRWQYYAQVHLASLGMPFLGRRIRRRHNLKPDVRISLYEETNVWLKELSKRGTAFMGGDTPNLADLSLHGVLSAIEGTKAFSDLCTNTKILTWYKAIDAEVKGHRGAGRVTICLLRTWNRVPRTDQRSQS